MSPHQIKKLSEVTAQVEKWEINVRRLASEYQEELSGGLKTGILIEMVPAEVADYLGAKLEDEDTYDDVKEHVLRYVETMGGRGCMPMELDRLETKGESEEEPEDETLDSVAKGGTKGKGAPFNGECHICGTWGHRAANCPQKGGSSWGLICHHCHQPGHRLSQCPVEDWEMQNGGKGYGKKGYEEKNLWESAKAQQNVGYKGYMAPTARVAKAASRGRDGARTGCGRTSLGTTLRSSSVSSLQILRQGLLVVPSRPDPHPEGQPQGAHREERARFRTRCAHRFSDAGIARGHPALTQGYLAHPRLGARCAHRSSEAGIARGHPPHAQQVRKPRRGGCRAP